MTYDISRSGGPVDIAQLPSECLDTTECKDPSPLSCACEGLKELNKVKSATEEACKGILGSCCPAPPKPAELSAINSKVLLQMEQELEKLMVLLRKCRNPEQPPEAKKSTSVSLPDSAPAQAPAPAEEQKKEGSKTSVGRSERRARSKTRANSQGSKGSKGRK
ncbi:hypothetical protein lerEdw1_002963 [Lerista edwardsae]|nr:hypothetical protein lerEdw1_002963 [Lerista edwardsae]